MLEALSAFIANYGYLNLFVLSFLAATILPLGSEALVVALIYQGFNPFTVIMVATLGNYLGSCTTYYLGLKGRPVLEKYLSPSPEKLEKSENLFKRYGLYTLLFTWVPGIGDAITMVAGLMQLPFRYFSILVFLGKFGRYFAIAYLTVFISSWFIAPWINYNRFLIFIAIIIFILTFRSFNYFFGSSLFWVGNLRL